jgi:hypothetical protein
MGRAEADDLDFLGPEPAPPQRTSREWQALARKEPFGMTRITSGPGRPPGGQKRTPEVMLRIVQQLSKLPVAKDAALANGVTTHAIKLWLTKSRLGQPGDGFDLVMNPDDDPSEHVIVRFHDAYDQALKDGAQEVYRAALTRALGYREPLTFQGRVIYKLDPEKVRLGMEGMDAYLLDDEGRPVPESVEKQDPDLMQFLLKGLIPETFGNRTKIEMEGKISGVLVVAQKAVSGADLNAEEKLYTKEKLQVTFEDDGDGDDNT